MSDMIDAFRDLRDYRKHRRATLGIDCPQCAVARPRAHPSKLLPGQRCKVDGYRDPRNPDDFL